MAAAPMLSMCSVATAMVCTTKTQQHDAQNETGYQWSKYHRITPLGGRLRTKKVCAEFSDKQSAVRARVKNDMQKWKTSAQVPARQEQPIESSPCPLHALLHGWGD
jgi:hypothetical protein